MLTDAATVLAVRDIVSSVAYYRDALGFDVTFQYGEPTYYACLCRDDVSLHLLVPRQGKRLPGQGGVAIFVKDVDALHAELAARGATILQPPEDRAYGMRDFDVVDADGNNLTFGMASRPAA